MWSETDKGYIGLNQKSVACETGLGPPVKYFY